MCVCHLFLSLSPSLHLSFPFFIPLTSYILNIYSIDIDTLGTLYLIHNTPVNIFYFLGEHHQLWYFKNWNKVIFFNRIYWKSFLGWQRSRAVWLHSMAVTTELCEVSLSRGTLYHFIKLLLSSGWRFIGSRHNREIISFGLWRVLITPFKLVFSSSVGTFNQYSLCLARYPESGILPGRSGTHFPGDIFLTLSDKGQWQRNVRHFM